MHDGGTPDGDQWVLVAGKQLVVSRSGGLHRPGDWIGVHINALPNAPIAGEFRFDITLHTTDRDGAPVRRLAHETVTTAVPTVATQIFQSNLPELAPASYTLEVTVHGGGIDRELRSSLTVPEQRVDARISPSRTTAHAGERLPFRLTNHGPTAIFYGVDYHLERSTPDGWENGNVEEEWALIGLSLGPGGTADESASIPDDAPPGRYRVTKDVSGTGTHLQQTLSFEFDVVPREDELA